MADEDANRNLEDYAESYLEHSADVLTYEWDEQYVVLAAGGVVMWILEFPLTMKDFHDYLDELDIRNGRLRIIDQVADQDNGDDPEKVDEVIAEAIRCRDAASPGRSREHVEPHRQRRCRCE